MEGDAEIEKTWKILSDSLHLGYIGICWSGFSHFLWFKNIQVRTSEWGWQSGSTVAHLPNNPEALSSSPILPKNRRGDSWSKPTSFRADTTLSSDVGKWRLYCTSWKPLHLKLHVRFVFYLLIFETESHCVAQDGLELAILPQSPGMAGITGVQHRAGLATCFFL
jgi:hypothetical protein